MYFVKTNLDFGTSFFIFILDAENFLYILKHMNGCIFSFLISQERKGKTEKKNLFFWHSENHHKSQMLGD